MFFRIGAYELVKNMSFSDSRGFNTIKKLLAIASIKVGEANNYIKFTQVYIYILHLNFPEHSSKKSPDSQCIFTCILHLVDFYGTCRYRSFTIHSVFGNVGGSIFGSLPSVQG